MDVPRWSHAMYAVQSVPNWKIFVFGGIGGEITDTNRGTFMNDVSIFDTGTERWMCPDIQGEPPLPRGDTHLEYYQQVRFQLYIDDYGTAGYQLFLMWMSKISRCQCIVIVVVVDDIAIVAFAHSKPFRLLPTSTCRTAQPVRTEIVTRTW